MPVLVGNAGSVKLAADTVAEIDKWSLNFGPNLVASESFGDSWEEKTATIRKWSGTFSGRFDNTDTNGAVALRAAALNGTTVALRLYTTGSTYYSGTAFIEVSKDVEETGLVTFSCSFTGSGALSYT